MIVTKMALRDYRNFKEKDLTLSDGITVIVGDNATGKTNILEAINLLATGKSFRAKVEEEMVHYDAELGRVAGKVKGQEEETKLEVVLTRGKIKVSESPERFEKVARKKLLVNGVGKRLVDFSSKVRAVLFSPSDMDLVTESPSVRRKFLDNVLSQVDREYHRSLISYEKGVRQRNKLLYRIREEGLSRSQLLFWDALIIKNGDYISSCREDLIEYINQTAPLDDRAFDLVYDKSAISEGRLKQYEREEVAAGTTLVGPHRDDFSFLIEKGESARKRELNKYGSRGEQRMGVLWAKMAELSFIADKIGERPLLLLDDIFSELDHEHRDIVMDVVDKQQTVITTADPHFVEGFEGVERISL